MESWHLIAAWATCAALAGVSYATTVDPERQDPRSRGGGWKESTAGVEGGIGGARQDRSGSVVEVTEAEVGMLCALLFCAQLPVLFSP